MNGRNLDFFVGNFASETLSASETALNVGFDNQIQCFKLPFVYLAEKVSERDVWEAAFMLDSFFVALSFRRQRS